MKLPEMLDENWSVPMHIGKQHMTVLAYEEAIDQVFIEGDEMHIVEYDRFDEVARRFDKRIEVNSWLPDNN